MKRADAVDDREIVDLFLARDETALRACEAKYGLLLKRLALGILRSREDSDEIANDALLAAWNAIPPEEPADLAAYLCRIARNLALNRLRRDRAAKRGGGALPADEALLERLPAPDSVEQAAEARETAARISAFLRAQPPETRQIFIRRYWFFDSPEEIAARRGMKPNTVKSILYRTKQKLFAYLKEEERT